MNINGARRALIVALTAALGLLLVGYARRSVETEMLQAGNYPRQNPSLSLELSNDGILRVEGEGKLYGMDMKSMLEEQGIRSKAVMNVVIGDGITEIGYGALSDRKHLLTIKVGKNVRRIAAGAIQNCPRLQCVYLPSGLESVGGDFLYGCDSCFVITDGIAGDLPAMENVSDDRLVERVDSYEALAEARGGDSGMPGALKHWWS